MKNKFKTIFALLLAVGLLLPSSIGIMGLTSVVSVATKIFSTTPMIAAGDTHTVALRSDGTVWTWGANGSGQLGDGTTTNHNTPVQVKNLSNVQAIAVGESFSMALRNDGTVWAWGRNIQGQLGIGTICSCVRPTPINSCGNLWRAAPVQVSGLSNIIAIASGGRHTVALRDDGTVWAWGNNQDGQLGDGTTINRHAPVQVNGLSNITAVAAGQSHTIALRNDNTAWAWGNNHLGQLGIGTICSCVHPAPVNSCGNLHLTTPVRVKGLDNVTAVVAGADFCIALRNDGTMWSWGGYQLGQLGVMPYSRDNTIPTQTNEHLQNITAISSGLFFTMALRDDGTVWAWGANGNGQLGDGHSHASTAFPRRVNRITNITSISAGMHHSLALCGDGMVWAWGYNRFGQLGNGNDAMNTRVIPVQVLGGETGNEFLNLWCNGTPATTPVTGITLDNTTLIMQPNTATVLHPTISPVNATNTDIIWTSSNPEVAFISDVAGGSNWGLINAVRVGTTTITATTVDGGISASSEVIVRFDSVAIQYYSQLTDRYETVFVPYIEDIWPVDSTRFCNDLALLAMALSAAAYRPHHIQNALTHLGAEDIALHNYFSNPDDPRYGEDNVAFALARFPLPSGQTIICVVVRGSWGGIWNWPSDWRSNIRFSTRNNLHLGFSIAMERVLLILEDYIGDDFENYQFFITGHSRGGAVANLLSYTLLRRKGIDTQNLFNYNFAAPNVSIDYVWNLNSSRYNSMFNINNTLDPVVALPNGAILGIFDISLFVPGQNWGRYGQDIDITNGKAIENHFYNHDSLIYLEYFQGINSSSLFDNIVGRAWNEIVGRVRLVATIKCPVDVEIVDSTTGRVVTTIVNNELSYVASGIHPIEDFLIAIMDDIKIISMNPDRNYILRLRGTDSGVMTYIVQKTDLVANEVINIKTFENIVLEDGKLMISYVGENIPVSDVQIFVTDENGTKIREINTDGTEVAVSIPTPTVPVTGVTIAGNAIRNMIVDETLQLNATVAPANATNRNVTWTSSNTNVATVNASGIVTAVGAGTATITVRTADGNRTAQVTVDVAAQPVIGMPAWLIVLLVVVGVAIAALTAVLVWMRF